MTKRRRGASARLRADSTAGAWRSMRQIADELGIGIIIGNLVDGPPCRITASLQFGIQQTEVTVEGPDEASALRELTRSATAWRQSNEVSLTKGFWGG
jgi:hypothetical protein